MADTARGAVSMTPVVTIPADLDADAVDAIHHDIGGSVGGKLEYSKADGWDKWFYSSGTNVTTDANLISGSFTQGGTIINTDIVRFLSITHTGLTNADVATSIAVHITLDGGDPKSEDDAIVIDKDESCILKPLSCTVDKLHAASSDDSSVSVKVVAILSDAQEQP